VDHGCWQTFCPAVYSFTATNIPFGATSPDTNFFIFGEVDNGSESTVGPYTGTEDGGAYEFESTEDYPLYYDLNSVFATLSGNTEQIQNHYNNLHTYYDPTTWAQQVIFLDNQDNPRFLSSSESNGNTNALEVALAFLYTSVGIPSLYYGTEQGFSGTTDPDCREDMFAGQWKDTNGTVESLSSPGPDNFNMTHPLFQWIARLNNFRRLYPAMSLGSYVNQWYNFLFAHSQRPGNLCCPEHRQFHPNVVSSYIDLSRRNRHRKPPEYQRSLYLVLQFSNAFHQCPCGYGQDFHLSFTMAAPRPRRYRQFTSPLDSERPRLLAHRAAIQ